jgi:hypothetical protein
VLACIASVTGTFVAALPLSVFDLWWVSVVDKGASSALLSFRSRRDRIRKGLS